MSKNSLSLNGLKILLTLECNKAIYTKDNLVEKTGLTKRSISSFLRNFNEQGLMEETPGSGTTPEGREFYIGFFGLTAKGRTIAQEHLDDLKDLGVRFSR